MSTTDDPIDATQAEQLPALADRPADVADRVADVLVETREVSAQMTPDEVRAELTARLADADIALPDADLDALVAQLVPQPEA